MIFEPLASFVTESDLWIPAGVDGFGRFPANVILGVAVLLIAYFIMSRTRFGTYVQAIGQSELISKHMGISPTRIKFLGFTMCGFFVGLGALSLTSFNGGMVPQIGMASMARVFTPMIGCFIGITLKKYCNVMLGIFIGQFILSMITLGLMTLRIDVSIQQFITGSFMILLVAISAANKKDLIVK
jgi:ribose transport system permease protein